MSQISYFELNNPPSIYGHAPPIHYNSSGDNKEYIIITPQYGNESIYIYDVQKDTFFKKFPYPTNFKPTDHINALNALTNELYVFGGFYEIFGSVNLKTQKWKVKFYGGTKTKGLQIKQQLNIDDYHLCFPYFINKTELHVFHRGKHLMFDTNYDAFITLSSNNNPFTKYGKILYVKHLSSKLMLFGGNNPIKLRENPQQLTTCQPQLKNIFYCDTENRISSEYKWKTFDVKLQYVYDFELCHIILVYDYIIIVFDLQRNITNCLDLLVTKKWYLSDVKFPWMYCGLNSSKSVFTVIDNKNYIHFMQCEARNGFHIKLSVKQCIPLDLEKIYRKRYEKLVIGYIKSKVEKIYNWTVPIPLKKIMVKYYPCFL